MKCVVFIGPETPAETFLAAGMLAILVEKQMPESVIVVCPLELAPLYKNAPFTCETIAYDRERTADPHYPAEMLARLPRNPPDLCINARTNRDPFSDAMALGSAAMHIIGHALPRRADQPIPTDAAAEKYSRLAPNCGVIQLEVQRHRDLLKILGIDVELVAPTLWTSAADRAWAQAFMQEHHLAPARTLILFPEPAHPLAAWPGFAQALAPMCLAMGLAIIAVGTAQNETETNQLQSITAAGVKVCDLRGKADCFQVAELMRVARAAAGLENVYAHIACAVGCRHAVVLAGGEFGRWLPYSPLTSAITLPLYCVGCNWKCRFEQPYCSTTVAPFMLQVALREILDSPEVPQIPRFFVQHPDFGLSGLAQTGKLALFDCLLNTDALPPFLYDFFLITSPSLNVFGTPPSLCGCTLRRVDVQFQNPGATP